MNFEDRIEQAIQRGQQRSAKKTEQLKQQALTAEQIKSRHNEFRLALSEHIEASLKRLAEHFPGFDYEMIYGARGWGGAIFRSDLTKGPDGRSGSFFSRLEIAVKGLNEYNVVNIAGKGTISDREVFTWNHFRDVDVANKDEFCGIIDTWIVEFAEQFAAR